jgi:hypothetical protein
MYKILALTGRWLAFCFLLVAAWVPAVQGQTMRRAQATGEKAWLTHPGPRTYNHRRQAAGKAYVDHGLSAAGDLPACPNNICPGLGNGFYLPAMNSLSIFTGGAVIFQNRTLGSCVISQPTDIAHRQFDYTTSSDNFLRAVSTEADLSGNYNDLALTFNGTFQSTTGYNVASQQNVQSLALDITYLTGVLDFQQNSTCWTQSNVDPSFLAAFQQLPPIGDATQAASWTPYITFLKTWGSHIMVQESLGSRFQQWESVTSTQQISQNILQAKACADVEGISAGGGWSVTACGAYSSAQKQEAESFATNEEENILGGTEATRQALLNGVTQQTLADFVNSADQADEAVEHGWTPIWSLLYSLYGPNCDASQKGSCANYQRAVNLEAAYEGWLAVGCSTVSTEGTNVQAMMVASTDPTTGVQTYGCWAKKEGCITDDDCHAGGFLRTNCYCYGSGCIVENPNQPVGDPASPSGYRDTIQLVQTGGYEEGVNNSCYYHIGGECDCSVDQIVGLPDRYLWQQSVDSLRLLRKNRK